ncbi:hypothetical protein BDP27DRAFT_1313467, partial [Rhodocollybia butyracea]
APANLGRSLQKLLPIQLPPSLVASPGNLYQVLSRTPSGGVGRRVYQLRWSQKNIPDCYWVITRTKFKCEGKHGRAWGKLFWKGNQVGGIERIRGSLKYTWAEGMSKATTAAPVTVRRNIYMVIHLILQKQQTTVTS